MKIDKFINHRFISIHPYEGVNTIEAKLLDEGFLVVMDEKKNFLGILTPMDLIKRPHKIVIDCLTPKEAIMTDATIAEAMEKFEKCKCSILPVLNEENFAGIIYKNELINALRNKVTELYKRSMISQNVKTSFLQSLSHEIRTPMNWILGFLEIITEMDEEEYRREGRNHFEIVQKSANKFLQIMNDLINISIINSGDDIRVEHELVDIDELFNELKIYFEKSTPILLNREVQIVIKYEETPFRIYSDGNKIKHILYHLIDNAIKHARAQTVEINYHIFQKNILLQVSNYGQSIPEERQDRLFEMFEKQDIKNEDYMSSGLGIGLSLVKKLAELLDGNISFVSDELQTKFSISIPYVQETKSGQIILLQTVNKEVGTPILPVDLSI